MTKYLCVSSNCLYCVHKDDLLCLGLLIDFRSEDHPVGGSKKAGVPLIHHIESVATPISFKCELIAVERCFVPP